MNLTLRLRASRIQGSAFSGVPISSSCSMTCDGAHKARGQVRIGGGDDARGERRGVHAVVREQHEVGVERAYQLWRRLYAIEHVQVVGGLREIGSRFHGLQTKRAAMESGKDGRERCSCMDRERDRGLLEPVLDALNRHDAA